MILHGMLDLAGDRDWGEDKGDRKGDRPVS